MADIVKLEDIIPQTRDNIKLSWSNRAPQLEDFIQLDFIPAVTLARSLPEDIDWFPANVPISSIAIELSTWTAVNGQEILIPIQAWRYWMDIHHLKPRLLEFKRSRIWLLEQLSYKDEVIFAIMRI